MANQVHNCPDMKTENTLRLFNKQPLFMFQVNEDGYIELACEGVYIIVSFCPCCGQKLQAEKIAG